MTPVPTFLRTLVMRLWRADAPLTATGLLMVPLLVLFAAGLWLDPRIVTGAPVWLKPAKFAVSIGIYTLTLAWVLSYLPGWPRTRRLAGGITAAALLLEVVLIALQAARGTTSHYNVGSAFDAAVFASMGIAIIVQTLASVAVAVALWRQTFADRALGWALRIGLTITIAGASTGALMTRPTDTQLAAAAHTRMTVAGAHTVGGTDGGPGLPGTGWSVEHGDLRVPHFVGLHALQALPLLVLLIPRRSTAAVRARLAVVAGASYAALFAILLAQALRGQPLVAPDAATAVLLAAWAALTAGAALLARRGDRLPAHTVTC